MELQEAEQVHLRTVQTGYYPLPAINRLTQEMPCLNINLKKREELYR